MYCKNCGAQLDNNAKFCNVCGGKIQNEDDVILVSNNQPVKNHYMSTREAERLSELNELDNMIAYFSQKQEAYKDYDCFSKELYRLRRGIRSAPLVWGIILSVLSLIFLCGGAIPNMFSKANSGEFYTYLFLSIFLSVIGTPLIVLFIIKKTRNGSRLRTVTEKCDALEDELWAHYENYGHCLVGFEYSNPANLVVIKQTINAGRADNTREAINILLDDAHKANMEAIAIQAARNAAQAARGSTAAAIFSAGAFFFR